ncbi:hypothetical protein E2562_037157 [Oryza meyeriana var. granulata]|uniref:Uncharacterized protein n=1 Tax=Oryza meyeriana var. granulata TaxID=110450 RepID=A0A6G1CLE4_9ORYZ|nr:hypothetical protein E2562_037157 [Oryza meyeriana var. granulata]
MAAGCQRGGNARAELRRVAASDWMQLREGQVDRHGVGKAEPGNGWLGFGGSGDEVMVVAVDGECQAKLATNLLGERRRDGGDRWWWGVVVWYGGAVVGEMAEASSGSLCARRWGSGVIEVIGGGGRERRRESSTPRRPIAELGVVAASDRWINGGVSLSTPFGMAWVFQRRGSATRRAWVLGASSPAGFAMQVLHCGRCTAMSCDEYFVSIIA